MGIDGIGGSGRPPPGGPSGVERSSGQFEVEAGQGASEVQGASEAQADLDIQRVERGEWTLDQYLDARVDRAVDHLRAVLPAEEMELLKQQLRTQMESDPLLQNLVRQATGIAPADNDSA